jgi:hypothetical protein
MPTYFIIADEDLYIGCISARRVGSSTLWGFAAAKVIKRQIQRRIRNASFVDARRHAFKVQWSDANATRAYC